MRPKLKDRKRIIERLIQTEEAVQNMKRLIEDNTYCDDVLDSIAQIQLDLMVVKKLILEHHLRDGVVGRIRAREPNVIQDLLVTLNRLSK